MHEINLAFVQSQAVSEPVTDSVTHSAPTCRPAAGTSTPVAQAVAHADPGAVAHAAPAASALQATERSPENLGTKAHKMLAVTGGQFAAKCDHMLARSPGQKLMRLDDVFAMFQNNLIRRAR